MPYFPICVMAKEAFQKGKLANSSFAAAYSPWTVGYMAGKSAIQTLGKKRDLLPGPLRQLGLGHARRRLCRRQGIRRRDRRL